MGKRDGKVRGPCNNPYALLSHAWSSGGRSEYLISRPWSLYNVLILPKEVHQPTPVYPQ
jgi:hypothetical protein